MKARSKLTLFHRDPVILFTVHRSLVRCATTVPGNFFAGLYERGKVSFKGHSFRIERDEMNGRWCACRAGLIGSEGLRDRRESPVTE